MPARGKSRETTLLGPRQLTGRELQRFVDALPRRPRAANDFDCGRKLPRTYAKHYSAVHWQSYEPGAPFCYVDDMRAWRDSGSVDVGPIRTRNYAAITCNACLESFGMTATQQIHEAAERLRDRVRFALQTSERLQQAMAGPDQVLVNSILSELAAIGAVIDNLT